MTDYGPINHIPKSLTPPHDTHHERPVGKVQYLAALYAALDGIELGTYDNRILDWMAGWDTSTVAVVVSLLHRARQAGQGEATGKGSR